MKLIEKGITTQRHYVWAIESLIYTGNNSLNKTISSKLCTLAKRYD